MRFIAMLGSRKLMRSDPSDDKKLWTKNWTLPPKSGKLQRTQTHPYCLFVFSISMTEKISLFLVNNCPRESVSVLLKSARPLRDENIYHTEETMLQVEPQRIKKIACMDPTALADFNRKYLYHKLGETGQEG